MHGLIKAWSLDTQNIRLRDILPSQCDAVVGRNHSIVSKEVFDNSQASSLELAMLSLPISSPTPCHAMPCCAMQKGQGKKINRVSQKKHTRLSNFDCFCKPIAFSIKIWLEISPS